MYHSVQPKTTTTNCQQQQTIRSLSSFAKRILYMTVLSKRPETHFKMRLAFIRLHSRRKGVLTSQRLAPVHSISLYQNSSYRSTILNLSQKLLCGLQGGGAISHSSRKNETLWCSVEGMWTFQSKSGRKRILGKMGLITYIWKRSQYLSRKMWSIESSHLSKAVKHWKSLCLRCLLLECSWQVLLIFLFEDHLHSDICIFSSVQFSHSVVSDSLQPHES